MFPMVYGRTYPPAKPQGKLAAKAPARTIFLHTCMSVLAIILRIFAIELEVDRSSASSLTFKAAASVSLKFRLEFGLRRKGPPIAT